MENRNKENMSNETNERSMGATAGAQNSDTRSNFQDPNRSQAMEDDRQLNRPGNTPTGQRSNIATQLNNPEDGSPIGGGHGDHRS